MKAPFETIPFSGPGVAASNQLQDNGRRAPMRAQTPLERKVVINAGCLIDSSDKPQDVLRKLAACVADAGGLGVDFTGL
jgi:hypothetical protein